MRFLIHELPYERPLLSGRLRYERDGRPTGAVESWRLSEAAEGYRFLRVDLDARAAQSGHSWLYHVTLRPDGRPEQIKARFWAAGHEVTTTVNRQGDEWFAARQVDGVAYEDVAHGGAFWFPAATGLALLRGCVDETRGVTLLMDTSDAARTLALFATPVTIAIGAPVEERVGDETLAARTLSVGWGRNRRTVWYDDDGRPLRLWRDDGLTATAERLVRYG
jgi:hypothetical protein